MRAKSSLILSILVSLFVFGCNSQSQPQTSQVEKFFFGKHPLQRLVQYTSQKGTLNGGGFFLLGVGGMEVDGKTETKQFVKFAWKSVVDDTFIVSSVLLERVRVRLKDDVNVPTVEFGLYCQIHNSNICGDFFLDKGQQEVINHGYVEYIIFTVKPNDWPLKIQMPL